MAERSGAAHDSGRLPEGLRAPSTRGDLSDGGRPPPDDFSEEEEHYDFEEEPDDYDREVPCWRDCGGGRSPEYSSGEEDYDFEEDCSEEGDNYGWEGLRPELPRPDTLLEGLEVLDKSQAVERLRLAVHAYRLRSAEAEVRLREREASEEHLVNEVEQLDEDCRSLEVNIACLDEEMCAASSARDEAEAESARARSECAKAEHERHMAESRRAVAEAGRDVLRKRLHEREDELRALKRSRPVVVTDVAWASLQHLPCPGQSADFTLRPLRTEDPVFYLLSDLVHRTCTQHRRELGAQDFCPAPQLSVKRIDFVMNPLLMRQYHMKAEEIAARRPAGCAPIGPLSHLKVPADPRALAPDLNAHLLFHGSRPETVDSICIYGFDPRRGGEQAGRLFGVATYLAANASKADTYTDLCRDSQARLPRSAERKLIVARALLGESWRVTQARQRDMRPPDGPDQQPLDSAWADTRSCGGVVDHLEVMLYDKGQAYPEYVVSYCHAGGCACAECCKRPAA